MDEKKWVSGVYRRYTQLCGSERACTHSPTKLEIYHPFIIFFSDLNNPLSSTSSVSGVVRDWAYP